MGVAPTAPMGSLTNVSTSNLAYNIPKYLCTNFGAFIKRCTIRPKMAAYPLYWNNITSNIPFVTRPRFGNLAIISSSRKNSTAANQSLFDNSFAVQGPKLWNAIPYHLNVIQDLQQDRLTKFMLSLPDKPPIRGYAAPNSNSLLCWRNDRGTTSLWGGQMN